MLRYCSNCGQSFDITQSDLSFYDKVSPIIAGKKYLVPPPTLCPDCRAQRRFAFRNERGFYKRPCDLCKKQIVSVFSPGNPFPVYCQECWWSDKWDALSYEREIDFSRPFFEQYRDLQNVVPRLAVMNRAAENSEYCNYASFNKNCYLAVGGSWYNENCLYGVYYARCKDSVDCFGLLHSELCYEVNWGEKLYHCAFCTDCFTSNDCFFSSNLRGCKNCILCTNLRNKENEIRNQPASPAQFAELKHQMKSNHELQKLKQEFLQRKRRSIRPATMNVNCENCSGDYQRNCRNVSFGFETSNIEDGNYLFRCEECKDLMDCGATGYNGPQLFYECINAGDGGERSLFSYNNWTCSDILYCDTSQSSHHCFGCVSAKRQKYCILNKQYSPEEYDKTVARLIEHMKKTREWGEFFPISASPFAFNETVAQEYFPITKEEAKEKGYPWKDHVDDSAQVTRTIPASQLPDTIDTVPDDVLQWAIRCEKSDRPFRITKQELAFYRQQQLPLPHLHPDERHAWRAALRNPMKLWSRRCGKCGEEMLTSFAPERPETVYCEECYLKEVY